jgi:hypothetical protein
LKNRTLTLRRAGVGPLVGLALTVAVHALVFTLISRLPSTATFRSDRPADAPEIVWLSVAPSKPDERPPQRGPEPSARAPDRSVAPAAPARVPQERPTAAAAAPRPPASMAAPPAPTAQEWAFAGRYTLKNSKAYRYTWGQQVRSMMGTAVEGPDQGAVRFRVEIAPDGRLARLETLWTTSPVAERLARRAVETLPRWPPTPTGQPLVFEKTISFTPFATDGPPLYKDDCLPDPPAFRNPFVWDGTSTQEPAPPPPLETMDPQALEDCLRQLPQDSIEAESAHDQRLMDQWGSTRPGR